MKLKLLLYFIRRHKSLENERCFVLWPRLVPQRIEGWVGLDDWLYTEVCLPEDHAALTVGKLFTPTFCHSHFVDTPNAVTAMQSIRKLLYIHVVCVIGERLATEIEDLRMLVGRNSAAGCDKCQLECRKLWSPVSDTDDHTSLSTCRPVTSLSVEYKTAQLSNRPAIQRLSPRP